MRLLKLWTKEEYEDVLKVQVLTHQLPHIHYFLRSRDGTVVRALSSYCHGPDLIPGPGVSCVLSLFLVLCPCLWGLCWLLQFSTLH